MTTRYFKFRLHAPEWVKLPSDPDYSVRGTFQAVVAAESVDAARAEVRRYVEKHNAVYADRIINDKWMELATVQELPTEPPLVLAWMEAS